MTQGTRRANNSWLCGMDVMWCHAMLWIHVHTAGAAECMSGIRTVLVDHAQTGLYEQSSSACVGIWANPVSPRCVMREIPGEHVECLAILSLARSWRPCRL